MVGSEWTSTEQKDFLESQLEEYAKFAATKRYGKFWTGLNEVWLRRWPMVQPDPSPELVIDPNDANPPQQLTLQQRRDKSLSLAIDILFQVNNLFQFLLTYSFTEQKTVQKIKTWFRWRYNNSTSTRGTTPKLTYTSAAPDNKGTRTKTAVETFQILFYQTRVKPFVTLELNGLKSAGNAADRSARLLIQRRITQELFDAADAATLSAVAARQASDKAVADAQVGQVMANEGDVEIRTPEQYQM